MSSPVFFTLMGRNDIFLSNLRSSEEENSVSDLGSEFEGIWSVQDAPPGLPPDFETFLKWNLNLKCFIVPFSHTESLDSLSRDVDRVQLFL